VRAIDDPRLVAELVSRNVTLNVCPGSNVKLGLYPDLAHHPLDALRRAGVPVSINTDDPALLSTDLVAEYAASARAYGWDRGTVLRVARTSVDASFCEPNLKQQLLTALDTAAED
jgi:adenosine deaminase